MKKKVQSIIPTEEEIRKVRLELIPHVRMRHAIALTDVHELFPHIEMGRINACIELLHHSQEVILGINPQDNNALWVKLGDNAWSLTPQG